MQACYSSLTNNTASVHARIDSKTKRASERVLHKLGAHYTPRAYVERLVMPTVINPIRAEWDAVHTAATVLANGGDTRGAAAEVRRFHRKLVGIRVLDPACGSGNFLYVTLEHLKRIEGEAFDMLDALGERQAVLEMTGETVDPHQLLGLEVNPRAAAIAELVLWIGTLQWHFRNRGSVRPPQPIIRNFHNIECRDALIAWDAVEPLLDDAGAPVTHWNGRITKPHPVTGREVPDEAAREPVMRYVNPRPAVWPTADYVIGNPPFIGPALMRQALGDGYTEAVRAAHADVSPSSDFVMYWWNHAAALARAGEIRRFGFVSTNSLRQTFNRRVLETHLTATPSTPGSPTCRGVAKRRRRGASPGHDDGGSFPRNVPTAEPLSLLFAIPDHPWVDAAACAAVRIAMTCAAAGEQEGLLQHVVSETAGDGEGYEVELDERRGRIQADLTVGANVAGAVELKANGGISSRGVQTIGAGFIVTRAQAEALGLGKVAGLDRHIRGYRNGRDLTATPRDALVIDLFGLAADEVRAKYPTVYQWVLERVKPERDANRDLAIQKSWWLHGRPRPELRNMLAGLPRYIATVETAKHRFFQFLDAAILPDNKLINVALDDAYFLGVLSSRTHVCWALATGGHLGVGNDPVYVKTRCFETFPFPDASAAQRARIRELGEQLDAHRKARQAEHAGLTMTGMYNVLEKLRAGGALTAKEKAIHEQGLVSVLRQLHEDLDAAVAEAYGWPAELDDAQLLERLVALNAARAAEKARGKIRWLRPDFQKHGGMVEQTELVGTSLRDVPTVGAEGRASPSSLRYAATRRREVRTAKQSWPRTLPEQVAAVCAILVGMNEPATPEVVARAFSRARADRLAPILETLVTLGQAHKTADGLFVGG
jgi:hypothetical protein